MDLFVSIKYQKIITENFILGGMEEIPGEQHAKGYLGKNKHFCFHYILAPENQISKIVLSTPNITPLIMGVDTSILKIWWSGAKV